MLCLFFYVFQGETFDLERQGGYVWSPKLDSAGHKNAGYTKMTEIKKGDIIFHNSNGKIEAISIAVTDCFEAIQPLELKNAETSVNWNDDGYRVNCEYHNLERPLYTNKHREWLKENYIKNSAFDINGRGKLQYMCNFASLHATYLLKEIIKLQVSDELLNFLQFVHENI